MNTRAPTTRESAILPNRRIRTPTRAPRSPTHHDAVVERMGQCGGGGSDAVLRTNVCPSIRTHAVNYGGRLANSSLQETKVTPTEESTTLPRELREADWSRTVNTVSSSTPYMTNQQQPLPKKDGEPNRAQTSDTAESDAHPSEHQKMSPRAKEAQRGTNHARPDSEKKTKSKNT